jgi:hypothetical protein
MGRVTHRRCGRPLHGGGRSFTALACRRFQLVREIKKPLCRDIACERTGMPAGA